MVKQLAINQPYMISYRAIFNLKRTALACLLFWCVISLNAQVKIHSHNDYEQKNPFYGAVKANVYSLEADVFLAGNSLCVAHHFEEIDTSRTFDKLYLQALYDYTTNTAAIDNKLPALMLDIKQDQEQALAILQDKL